jgi:hypothetical protein
MREINRSNKQRQKIRKKARAHYKTPADRECARRLINSLRANTYMQDSSLSSHQQQVLLGDAQRFVRRFKDTLAVSLDASSILRFDGAS